MLKQKLLYTQFSLSAILKIIENIQKSKLKILTETIIFIITMVISYILFIILNLKCFDPGDRGGRFAAKQPGHRNVFSGKT